MNRPPLKTLLLGATGHFGSIIARRLRGIPGVGPIVAGRNTERVRASAADLGVAHAVLDRDDPAFASKLRDLAPALVIVTAGPFQSQDFRVARACIAAGAHYVDIADGREFVCGIRALDAAAKERDVCVISGASSVPTLSSAVIERLVSGFDVESIDFGITTSSRSPGLATVRAVLGYCGRRVPHWRDGAQAEAYGSQGGWRRTIEGVGSRAFLPADVPDLTLLRERFLSLRSLRFGAGSEMPGAHSGLGVIAAAVRAGLVTDASRLARPLIGVSRWLERFGTGTSAMYVDVAGRTPEGRSVSRTWELVASSEDGANIPCMAVVCLARKFADGTLTMRGAFPGAGLVTLDEYLRELEGLDIRVRTRENAS
ncbi:hypothetical protein DSM104443_03909 [Usitatibacter rugosus]|uniref:Saccharopine dehydrogenase NADP binding domain-containing protein n=1 Tax=Usitatibacter rugosus TaxID=2732067 RepID=A0A6M4GZY4_9PROT|nr:saccharopine dehydrogenase NADP-binding domain-containing protein [Usitatibacter rugosus]QJR12816.1 hypothetical protein DSM104443_03909 [Usitatibacter rugosus]